MANPNNRPQTVNPDDVQWDQPDQSFPVDPNQVQWDEDKYGTPEQKLKGIAEAGISGLISRPATTAIEQMAGVKPEDILGRQKTAGWPGTAAEALGLGLGALSGVGPEAKLLGAVGETAAKFLPEAVGPISKIFTHGITTGAEMAAMQSQDELSNMINNDPEQSLGSAIQHVMLSTALGGVLGAGIGTVQPLWKASLEKLGIPKGIDKMKAQWDMRQSAPGGDMGAAVTNEMNLRMAETKAAKNAMSNLKSTQLEKLMPETSSENTVKIDNQIKGLAGQVQSNIDDIVQSKNPYLTPMLPKLEFHKNQLLSAVTPAVEDPSIRMKVGLIDNLKNTGKILSNNVLNSIEDSVFGNLASPVVDNLKKVIQNPAENSLEDALSKMKVPPSPVQSYMNKFDVLDNLKGEIQNLVNYGRGSAEEGKLAQWARPFAHDIRVALEDTKVWGEAGNLQKQANAAITKSSSVEDKILPSLMNNEGKISQDKITTLLKQTAGGKGIDKNNAIKAYLENSDNLEKTLNLLHDSHGLEAPVRLTPMKYTEHAMKMGDEWTRLANWMYDKGLSSMVGEGIGAGAGSIAGGMMGHPVIGGLIGERLLPRVVTPLAKALLETKTNGEAAKSAMDYVADVLKGNKILPDWMSNFFKGTEAIPKHIIPDVDSMDKLKKILNKMDDPQAALRVAGNLNHYLPAHATAAATLAATAKNYLDSMKPMQMPQSALDNEAPENKIAQERYDRALEIAEQPLMALHYAQKGTLKQQDVQTLQTLYPKLHAQYVQGLFGAIAQAKADGKLIPYKQRQALSMLMGTPLDSTLKPQSVMSIMAANAPRHQAQGPGGQTQKAPSKLTQAGMNRVNQMYSTPEQARIASKSGMKA